MVFNVIGFLVILIVLWLIYAIGSMVTWKIWWDKYNKMPFNFPFKYKGKTLWYSRACAVASFIFNQDKKGNWYVLANKRGKGTPDFQGMWNCSCGYVSFNETCAEAASRETYEETGINLDKTYYKFYGINDDPKDSNKQNITIRFYAVVEGNPIEVLVPHKTNLGEVDEVEEVKWIPVLDIDSYEWAFNHKNVIKEIFNKKIA